MSIMAFSSLFFLNKNKLRVEEISVSTTLFVLSWIMHLDSDTSLMSMWDCCVTSLAYIADLYLSTNILFVRLFQRFPLDHLGVVVGYPVLSSLDICLFVFLWFHPCFFGVLMLPATVTACVCQVLVRVFPQHGNISATSESLSFQFLLWEMVAGVLAFKHTRVSKSTLVLICFCLSKNSLNSLNSIQQNHRMNSQFGLKFSKCFSLSMKWKVLNISPRYGLWWMKVLRYKSIFDFVLPWRKLQLLQQCSKVKGMIYLV